MSTLEHLPSHARVWVYQAERTLNTQEINFLQQELEKLVNSWKAHEIKLSAGSDVLYHMFTLLAVDEAVAKASGCSIDTSVRWMQQMSDKMGVNLIHSGWLAYVSEDNTIKQCYFSDIETLYKQGIISDNTIVFNNLISSVSELKNSWKTPFGSSPHKKLIRT